MQGGAVGDGEILGAIHPYDAALGVGFIRGLARFGGITAVQDDVVHGQDAIVHDHTGSVITAGDSGRSIRIARIEIFVIIGVTLSAGGSRGERHGPAAHKVGGFGHGIGGLQHLDLKGRRGADGTAYVGLQTTGLDAGKRILQSLENGRLQGRIVGLPEVQQVAVVPVRYFAHRIRDAVGKTHRGGIRCRVSLADGMFADHAGYAVNSLRLVFPVFVYNGLKERP